MQPRGFAAVALLGVLAGAGVAPLPESAIAAPQDGTSGSSQSQLPDGKISSRAEVIVLSTAQRQFDPGVNNQGWWSNSENFANDDSNDNYALIVSNGGDARDFFTFDVSALDRRHVVSATLRINTADFSDLGGSEVFRLSDVSTDAVSLNENTGIDSDIFRDLGTGRIYAEYAVGAIEHDEWLMLDLNKAAVRDLRRATTRAPSGFFSIGGTLLNSPSAGGMIFSNSQGRPVELVVRIRHKR